jgi:hypothetical protein
MEQGVLMDNPDEILIKDINWSAELEKFRKPLEEYLNKCLQEKKATLEEKESDTERYSWMRKALINAFASQMVVFNYIHEIRPDLDKELMILMLASSYNSSTALSSVFDLIIIEEKKKEKESQVSELEELYGSKESI